MKIHMKGNSGRVTIAIRLNLHNEWCIGLAYTYFWKMRNNKVRNVKWSNLIPNLDLFVSSEELIKVIDVVYNFIG